MPRPRKSNPLGLLPRMRFSHGQFYYVHRDERWEPLGTDLAKAKERARHHNDARGQFGTMAWYLDEFLAWCATRVAANKLASRTLADYRQNVVPLKAYLGKMLPTDVTSVDVQRYLDLGVELDRDVRANREKACLSACFTWIKTRRPEAGLQINPCFGVRRNRETPSDVYVEHTEYTAVAKRASAMVALYAELVYRTLQRPSDVLTWTRANLRTKPDATGKNVRVITFTQSKTGAELNIEIDAHIEKLLASVPRDVIGVPLIHTRRAGKYTESGIASMWRRYCVDAIKAGELSRTFGVMDLRAKGATDMYLAGTPLETIQALMGHESVTTTEIYIKQRLKRVVTPNQTPLPQAVAE